LRRCGRLITLLEDNAMETAKKTAWLTILTDLIALAVVLVWIKISKQQTSYYHRFRNKFISLISLSTIAKGLTPVRSVISVYWLEVRPCKDN
jgi:hypothetical protein